MLQKLLENRFKLALHQEARSLPIFSLGVAKNGSKLREAEPGNLYSAGVRWPSGVPVEAHFVMWSFGTGHATLTGQSASIGQLIERLTQNAQWLGLDGVIVDNTGLSGRYDFDLKFTVPWPPGGTEPGPSSDAGAEDAPNMFSAFPQQLGLKLERVKGNVETLVIDHIESPSEN